MCHCFLKNISYSWTSEADNGIYDAMNKGVRIVAGELVGIINSYDWYELDACEVIYRESLSSSELKAIYGICAMAHSVGFVKGCVYNGFGFELKYKLVADVDFIFQVFLKYGRYAKFTPNVIANFRYSGVSYTQFYLSKKENYQIRFKYGVISCNELSG